MRYQVKTKKGIAIIAALVIGIGIILYQIRCNESASTVSGDYIKWVEFNASTQALQKACRMDIESYQEKVHLDWITLLAYAAVRGGGEFDDKSLKYIDEIAAELTSQTVSREDLADKYKYFNYYYEAYGAVLSGMLGEYEIEEETKEGVVKWNRQYGLKAYSPIAAGFNYQDYDDFGAARSFGYRRPHLGHDMMGLVGTPVIATESGYVEALGWNRYGGWRIGIDSFDGKRYYYYAHLRQDRPYAEGLEEGDVVQAGDVIGYMGRTGYSTEENTNNIDVYHLHLGLQLIFDESQREGANEIWIDVYPLTRFLARHTSEAVRDDATKEWSRRYQIRDPEAPADSAAE